MADTAQFWNRLADHYAASPIADETSYQTKLTATQRLFRPDMEVFEFGCGTGSTALLHAAHVRHIHATDFSVRMIEIAKGKAEAAGTSNVTFEQADFATMPVAPARYDMVMGHSILHLVPDPQAAIDKAFAMLRPGGYLVTSTVCMAWGPLALMIPIAPLGKALGKLPHLNFFTANGLEKMQRRAGFEIVHRWHPGGIKAVFFIARKPA